MQLKKPGQMLLVSNSLEGKWYITEIPIHGFIERRRNPFINVDKYGHEFLNMEISIPYMD